jgi:lipoprotein-anchoring transpeptidase ErfK/SrfK
MGETACARRLQRPGDRADTPWENAGETDPMSDQTPTPDPRPAPTDEPVAPPATGARHATRRLLLAFVAVLVPIVPIVVGLLATGGAARPAPATTTQTSAYQPLGHAAATRHPRRRASPIPPGSGALVGYVSHPEAMHAAPGGRKIAEIETKTGFGSPTFVLVTRVRGRWLGVINTAAGNNRIGWIPIEGVSLSRDAWRLHAVLARHQLYVFHDGHQVRHFPIATGKPTAPTPTGHFAVTDRLTTGDPEGPYGCCILALSAQAPHHISDWDGGNRIAIHSTPETYSIGYSVSHGCMRLSLADGEWLIRHIPLGTPATISSA